MSIEKMLKMLGEIKTPAYVLDEEALIRNLERAADIRKRADVKIILATKAFAMFQAFPLMRPYLDGTTASGFYEAKLAAEEFGKETHVYSPAFDDEELKNCIPIVSHISFNSAAQVKKYTPVVRAARKDVSLGLRINPELPLTKKEGFDKYNPCAPCSRMGTIRKHVDEATLAMVDGLHFHVLCENMAEDSVKLIDFVDQNFGAWVKRMTWVNFGGGHFINHPDYDIEKLIKRLQAFRQKYPDQEVFLEPGGALVYDAGYLASTVVDLTENEKPIAILDASASTHMPDVLEVPYRPRVYGSGEAGEKKYDYIFAGKTCMTADVIGDYSFDKPLKPGDRVLFTEMMQYSFVKNTNFNGVPLPDLSVLRKDGSYEVLQSFGYEDFKVRLGSLDKSNKAGRRLA